MVEVTATIKNSMGIHCRPSVVIVKATRDFVGELELIAPQGTCDPRSILPLISLGLTPGTCVKLRVSGEDEVAFAATLPELFERCFDFEPMPGSISPLRKATDSTA